MSSKIGKLFSRPVHPVLEGVGTGGGIAGGVAYDFLEHGNWYGTTKALVTMTKYWGLRLDGGYQGKKAQFKTYTQYRYMNRLNFFGPGPDSNPDLRTTFTERDPVAGVLASVKVVPAVEIGGRVERMWPRISPGRHPETPSIEERFSDFEAPGLSIRSEFGRFQAFVQATAPPDAGRTLNQGGA